MATLSGDDKVKQGFAAMFDYAKAMSEFQEAVVAEYGDQSGGAFAAPEDMTPFGNINFDEIEVETDGDTAICIVPGETDEMKLVKEDGKWYLDMNDMMGSDVEDMDAMVSMFTGMKEALEEVKPKIGQPGVTAESLSMEFQQAMMRTMMEAGEGMSGAAIP